MIYALSQLSMMKIISKPANTERQQGFAPTANGNARQHYLQYLSIIKIAIWNKKL